MPGVRPLPTVTFGGSNFADGAPGWSEPEPPFEPERSPGEASWTSARPDPTLVCGAWPSGLRLSLPCPFPPSAPRRLPPPPSQSPDPPPESRRESPQSRSEFPPRPEPPPCPGSAVDAARPGPPSSRKVATRPTAAARRGFDRATVPLPRVAKTGRRRAQCILACRRKLYPGSSANTQNCRERRRYSSSTYARKRSMARSQRCDNVVRYSLASVSGSGCTRQMRSLP
jgi:hypothetical protein